MLKTILLALTFMSFIFLFGQNHIVLYDSTDNITITNATITSINSPLKLHAVSDSLGRFDKRFFNNNTILIEHLTYKELIVKSLSSTDSIFLTKKKFHIPEIEIVPQVTNESYELGNYRMKIGFLLFNVYNGNKGRIVATKIENDHTNSTIEGILISKKKETKNSRYKVFFFAVNEKGEPGDTIFSKIIEQKTLIKKDLIDISELQLKIPKDGIFIGFQWIEDTEYDDYLILNFTTEIEENKTFILLNRPNQKWLPYSYSGPYNNARFGLKMNPQH